MRKAQFRNAPLTRNCETLNDTLRMVGEGCGRYDEIGEQSSTSRPLTRTFCYACGKHRKNIIPYTYEFYVDHDIMYTYVYLCIILHGAIATQQFIDVHSISSCCKLVKLCNFSIRSLVMPSCQGALVGSRLIQT